MSRSQVERAPGGRHHRFLPMLFLAVAAGSAESQTEWVFDTLDASVHVSSVSLAIDSSNGLHACYRDAVAQALAYGTFASGTWTAEILPGGGNWCCIATSPSGDPSVSYSLSDRLRFARKSGGSWTTELVDPVHASGYVISHGLDAQGHAHISSYDGGLSIYYATDAGGAWSVEPLCTGNAHDGGSIAVGSEGDPRVVYPVLRVYSTEDGLIFARRQNGLWQRETADTTRYSHSRLRLALDIGNAPRVAYLRTRSWIDTGVQSIEYTTKTAEGTWRYWGIDGVYCDMVEQNWMSLESFALDHEGVPHIVYRKHVYNSESGEEPRDTLFYAYMVGDSWVRETILISPSAWPSGASLVIDSRNTPIVLFGGPSPQYGLYLARRCDATDTPEAPRRPSGLRLSVAPNPSRDGRGAISFGMPGSGPGDLSVYDICGRLVRSIRVTGPSGAVLWDGTDDAGRGLPPGVYFIRLSEDRKTETERVTIVR